MGNFFTSIQIHNPEQLSKEQFIELFCNKMKENGFVVGNEDDHEISYALGKFSTSLLSFFYPVIDICFVHA